MEVLIEGHVQEIIEAGGMGGLIAVEDLVESLFDTHVQDLFEAVATRARIGRF